MIKTLLNPNHVLTDCDNIENIDAQRMAAVLGKHLYGFKRGDERTIVKTLGLDANDDVCWSASGVPGGGLPPSTPEDEGKILAVDENGDPEWTNLVDAAAPFAIANGSIAFTPEQFYTNGRVTLSDIRSSDIEYAYNHDGWVLEKDHVYVIAYNIVASVGYPEDGRVAGRIWLDGFQESDQVWKFSLDTSVSHDESLVGTAIVCPQSTGEVHLNIRYDSPALEHVPAASVNKAEIVDVTARVSGGGLQPVQSNWAESDSQSLAFIQNKPFVSKVVYSDWDGDFGYDVNIPILKLDSESHKVSGAGYDLGVMPPYPTTTESGNRALMLSSQSRVPSWQSVYSKSETDTLLGSKQPTLTAGTNVSIDANNVISATDTTYTAGDNITISADNVISSESDNLGWIQTACQHSHDIDTDQYVKICEMDVDPSNSYIYSYKISLDFVIGGTHFDAEACESARFDGVLTIYRDVNVYRFEGRWSGYDCQESKFRLIKGIEVIKRHEIVDSGASDGRPMKHIELWAVLSRYVSYYNSLSVKALVNDGEYTRQSAYGGSTTLVKKPWVFINNYARPTGTEPSHVSEGTTEYVVSYFAAERDNYMHKLGVAQGALSDSSFTTKLTFTKASSDVKSAIDPTRKYVLKVSITRNDQATAGQPAILFDTEHYLQLDIEDNSSVFRDTVTTASIPAIPANADSAYPKLFTEFTMEGCYFGPDRDYPWIDYSYLPHPVVTLNGIKASASASANVVVELYEVGLHGGTVTQEH